MSAALVDSNVLLDVVTEDAIWFPRSAAAVRKAAQIARLVMNPIVFAEISVRYSRIEDLDAAFPASLIEREDIPYEAAFLAGKAFLSYKRRGGIKQSPLSDFFIGAHAVVAGYSLMTRDVARYRTYFPDVPLIVP